MFKKKREQNELKQRYLKQYQLCEYCGFPYPTMTILIYEGFFSKKRIYREEYGVCKKCEMAYTIVG